MIFQSLFILAPVVVQKSQIVQRSCFTVSIFHFSRYCHRFYMAFLRLVILSPILVDYAQVIQSLPFTFAILEFPADG